MLTGSLLDFEPPKISKFIPFYGYLFVYVETIKYCF